MPKLDIPPPPAAPTTETAGGDWQLAVNLFDLDRVDPTIRGMLLGGKLELKPITVDRSRPDETAVAFVCDLLSAACICDTLRSRDREMGDSPTRVYISRKGAGWRRLSGQAVLAADDVDGRLTLSDEVFPRPVALVAGAPPAPEAVVF